MTADFVPLPGDPTGTLRVRPERAAQVRLKGVVADLHDLHLTDSVIGKLVKRDRSQVRRILNELGLKEVWSNIADVRSMLPTQLLEACAQCATRVAVAPT
jgi:hypothetical protein